MTAPQVLDEASAGSHPSRPLRIGIVAGEASGDILGAGLMAAILKQHPDAVFEGVGGKRMLALGFNSFYPMDRLSVMGLVEPLKRLPELLRMRRQLYRHFAGNPPDVFLGIDSPDFNTTLELRLRERGVTTAHYVSPSVWAWRQGRIHKIARAVDLMLTLFTFEARFYQDHNVPVSCVGHSLADEIPMQDQREVARAALGIAENATVLAVLPGSRAGEVGQLLPAFLDTIAELGRRHPDWQIYIPAANDDRRAQIEQGIAAGEGLSALEIHLTDGDSQQIMAAADAVLMASGTTTLEACLLRRPMVVCYRFPPISYWILSRLFKGKFMALPNLLADQELVPELRQNRVSAEVIVPLLERAVTDSAYREQLNAAFGQIHRDLAKGASAAAAEEIRKLAGRT